MLVKKKYHPIVDELVQLIDTNNWKEHFQKAIQKAHSKNVPLLDNVENVEQYLDWMNDFLYWVPNENSLGQIVNDHLSASYTKYN